MSEMVSISKKVNNYDPLIFTKAVTAFLVTYIYFLNKNTILIVVGIVIFLTYTCKCRKTIYLNKLLASLLK